MLEVSVSMNIVSARGHISFLNNYALVFIAIGKDQNIRMRELAHLIWITERAVQRIIDELVKHQYLTVVKLGRRNSYELSQEKMLGYPFNACSVSDLLKLCNDSQ